MDYASTDCFWQWMWIAITPLALVARTLGSTPRKLAKAPDTITVCVAAFEFSQIANDKGVSQTKPED